MHRHSPATNISATYRLPVLLFLPLLFITRVEEHLPCYPPRQGVWAKRRGCRRVYRSVRGLLVENGSREMRYRVIVKRHVARCFDVIKSHERPFSEYFSSLATLVVELAAVIVAAKLPRNPRYWSTISRKNINETMEGGEMASHLRFGDAPFDLKVTGISRVSVRFALRCDETVTLTVLLNFEQRGETYGGWLSWKFDSL